MIEFIFFDVGGVVIKDFSCTNIWEDLKMELGIPVHKDESYERVWKQHEDEICTGRDVDSLLPILTKEIGVTFHDDFSLLDAFVKRFRKNQILWPLLFDIERTQFHDPSKKGIQLGLMTNMYPGMLDMIKQYELMPPTQWQLVIDSSVEGVKKPDQKIFDLAEERTGISPDKMLLIDNTEQNVQAAKDKGWQAYYFDSCNYDASTLKLRDFLAADLLQYS